MEDYKKKYEEALERARVWKEKSGMPVDRKGILDDIFPELKESEEENIRKSIIGFLKTMSSLKDGKTVSNEDFDSEVLLEWAAWLEKQGEQIDIANKEYWRGYREGKKEILDKYAEVEKQGETFNYNPYKETIKSISIMIEKYAQSGSDLQDFYNNVKVKCKDAVEYDKAFIEKQGERKQNVTDIISDLENYFATTTKEQQEKDWGEIKNWEEKHFNHDRHIEQKPNFCHHEVDLSDCSEEYRKAYYDGWNNCNQQHAQLKAEQKPAWSEEDKDNRKNRVPLKDKEIKVGDIITYFENGKKGIMLVSSFDSGIYPRCKWGISHIGGTPYGDWSHGIGPYYAATETEKQKLLNTMPDEVKIWFKSIKEQVTWSEEDEQMINDIIEAIDTQYAVSDYNEMVSWLKSLKERLKGE